MQKSPVLYIRQPTSFIQAGSFGSLLGQPRAEVSNSEQTRPSRQARHGDMTVVRRLLGHETGR